MPFAVLVVGELPVPHSGLISQVVLITVLLSVVLHGITAAPLARRYAETLDTPGNGAMPELEPSPVVIRKAALDTAKSPRSAVRPSS